MGLRTATGGDQLFFSVFDTGIGIAEADQARLFARFMQVDSSASRGHDGTGLGLAISRQLAQLMGGDVTVVSRPQHGSTFTLAIPLRQVAAPASLPAARARVVRGDVRILLAEDNEVNQLVAQRLLARLGYANTTAVFTGREAVEACTHASFDVVLMDCQMPVMDGWEATRALRAMGMQAPILAFTASATSRDRERCLQAGMNDFMTKPVELEVLADKMHRWVPAAAQHGEAAGGPQAFDAEAIARRFYGDPTLFAQAREIFVRQTGAALRELGGGPLPEPAALHRLVHRIRGSAAMIGASRLADICQRVEEGREGSQPRADAWLREAQGAFETFVRASQGDAAAG